MGEQTKRDSQELLDPQSHLTRQKNRIFLTFRESDWHRFISVLHKCANRFVYSDEIINGQSIGAPSIQFSHTMLDGSNHGT